MEVLQAYRKMDAAGERLTAGGWYRASKFFVKPGRRPEVTVAAVTEGERVTDPDPWFKRNNAVEISVVCEEIGQIDSSGRFTSVVSPWLIDRSALNPRQPVTPQQKLNGPASCVRPYDLVLTDTHWEFGPGGLGLREVKGPPEWRIETFELYPWVTSEAAIRYLTQLRDESPSGTIKRNADKSIATLRRFLGDAPPPR